MQEGLEKAQAAANQKQTRMPVFRSVNLNSVESFWFNASGVNDHSTAELVKVVEPQHA